jgi:hypothetical protein
MKEGMNKTEAILARLQEMKDAYASAKAYALAGLGLATGTIAGGFIKKYPSMRASKDNIGKRK